MGGVLADIHDARNKLQSALEVAESLLNRLAAIKHAFVPKVSIRDDKGLLK